jgi:hypothetical protein
MTEPTVACTVFWAPRGNAGSQSGRGDLTRYVRVPRDERAGRADTVLWEETAWGPRASYTSPNGLGGGNTFFANGTLVCTAEHPVDVPLSACTAIYELYTLENRASIARQLAATHMYLPIREVAAERPSLTISAPAQ